MFGLLLFVLAFLMFSYLILRGEDLSYLDQPIPRHHYRKPSEEMQDVLRTLRELSEQPMGSGRGRIKNLRDAMDELGDRDHFESEFVRVQNGDVRGEWVLAPGYDNQRRLLYIHGGAFFAGSPRSHRPITDRLARLTGAAVFAVDYRLMPEHRRMAGIIDCREAYRWLLGMGPAGPGEPDFLVVAGDSAGGNLTLTTLAWARDEGIRQADAGIALSPATDAALDAPALRDNVASDPMLGPAFGKLTKVPSLFLFWYTWITTRMMPSNPLISPVRGSLAGLPPILVQASDTEMLLDDARRYVAKAQAADSPVVLQTWPDMVHVWQVFTPQLPEAEEAYENIAEFLASVDGSAEGELAA